jgi:hypothetical protein
MPIFRKKLDAECGKVKNSGRLPAVYVSESLASASDAVTSNNAAHEFVSFVRRDIPPKRNNARNE